ncbi:site-specific integrase [Bacillus methanolicus]|uniref:site-specific integrase n=1 Tax=Bacillus methanolicus TaxID=1471 RepID=UPI0023807AA3|nr:site-specific integrase [Bacillus methanolicus]MDE3839358.1 site-specific integrase [Bacillus methanolicus]
MKGYIRKRGNSWSFTVDIGKDPRTGKRKQKTRSGFKTKKEAQAALAELITNVDKGTYKEPHKRLFKDFSLEYVQNTYKNKVKASTYERTYSLLVNQIIPWFQNVELEKIDQDLIHQFYTEKINEGLSSAYVRRMHEVIKMLLRRAKTRKLITEDIASLIEAPRLEKKEMQTWSIEEVNEFLKYTKHSRYHPVFFLAAYTGMRKGEILALHWDDIDFEKKTITIKKTLYRIKDQYLLTEPKTLNAIRTIYIDDDIVRVLKKQRVKQNLEKLKYGGVYQDQNLVFAQEDGSFVQPSAVNALFLRFIRQMGIKRIRFHDLRHTHATILLQMGVNPKIVAERLGHSSVQITLDTYSHVLPSMKKDLAEQFSKAMKRGQNVVNRE